MFHDCDYFRILCLVCYITIFSKQCCEKRCANRHSDFISKRNKSILESIISKSRLPFAIFHTIRNNCINCCIKPREKELCNPGERIKCNWWFFYIEEVHCQHCNTCEQCKDRCSSSFIIQLPKYWLKTCCTNNGRNDNTHRICCIIRSISLYISKII